MQGIHEAVELRDGDAKRYGGKGVLKAVSSINDVFSSKLKGFDVTQQKKIDAAMIELDGTANKGKLGANAILAVSLAVAKAGAAARGVPLYRHFAHLAGRDKVTMPVPMANVLNGGVHASNALAMQEFMVSGGRHHRRGWVAGPLFLTAVCVCRCVTTHHRHAAAAAAAGSGGAPACLQIAATGAGSFSEAIRWTAETYQVLKGILKKKYGINATGEWWSSS